MASNPRFHHRLMRTTLRQRQIALITEDMAKEPCEEVVILRVWRPDLELDAPRSNHEPPRNCPTSRRLPMDMGARIETAPRADMRHGTNPDPSHVDGANIYRSGEDLTNAGGQTSIVQPRSSRPSIWASVEPVVPVAVDREPMTTAFSRESERRMCSLPH